MPVPRRLTRLALLALVAASCDEPTTTQPAEDPNDPASWAPSLAMVSEVPTICGDPTRVGLMLGPRISTGSVEVANDESSLYVTFRSESWRPILATAVFVGDSPDEIPTTSRGLPRLLQFPYKSGHPDRPREVVWQIPLNDVSGEEAVVAAFAQVGLLPSWGDGQPITPGRDWAMYFTHAVAACGPEPVGPEGGTASADDGRATLSVPAGALEAPAAITMSAAALGDLLNQIPPEQYDPELGTVFGVTPVPGTIWDLQPDGLEFLEPATIMLQYDESALPEGVSEEGLVVFVVNGILEELFGLLSTVDAENNTVSAPVEHFTTFFLGASLADLEVSQLLEPPGPAEVGVALEFGANVTNLGPGATGGATFTWVAFGDVTLDGVFGQCSEIVNPTFGDVAVECAVAALDEGGVDGIPVFRIVPGSTGPVEVWATVGLPVGAVDLFGDNDRLTSTVDVDPALVADLTLSALWLSSGTPRVGTQLEYAADVQNLGPDAVTGATRSEEHTSELQSPT